MREAFVDLTVAYKPTAGMVRALALAGLGRPAGEGLEHRALRLRGLVDGFGRLTPAGRATLDHERVRRGGHA